MTRNGSYFQSNESFATQTTDALEVALRYLYFAMDEEPMKINHRNTVTLTFGNIYECNRDLHEMLKFLYCTQLTCSCRIAAPRHLGHGDWGDV